MKAWAAFDGTGGSPYTAIVFAENAQKAKAAARWTDALEDVRYIDIRVQRIEYADVLDDGRAEADLDDPKVRELLRGHGWWFEDDPGYDDKLDELFSEGRKEHDAKRV